MVELAIDVAMADIHRMAHSSWQKGLHCKLVEQAADIRVCHD